MLKGVACVPSVSTVAAASVPAAPPNCTGNSRASSCRPAAATPWNHCAARSPKVYGSECCVRLLPTHSVSACCSARRGERRRGAFQVRQHRIDRVPGQQHQGGVQHVLAGQGGVDGFSGTNAGGVERRHLLPEVGEQRDDRVAAALGAQRDVGERRSAPPRQRKRRRRRNRQVPGRRFPARRPSLIRRRGSPPARPGPRSAPPPGVTLRRD